MIKYVCFPQKTQAFVELVPGTGVDTVRHRTADVANIWAHSAMRYSDTWYENPMARVKPSACQAPPKER